MKEFLYDMLLSFNKNLSFNPILNFKIKPTPVFWGLVKVWFSELIHNNLLLVAERESPLYLVNNARQL